jgi:hypothetical protein
MSRHISDLISPSAWRVAITGLIIVTNTAIIAALLIARQSYAINTALVFDRFDEDWMIRSGSAESDRLVLRPAAHSIGVALRPIESSAFTLQARVAFDPPQGAAGLIVQADDPDHFSAFLISGDGYFRVSDYRNGAWIDRAAWRTWPHIRRDGAANVLRAECQSDTCTFFVNDEWTWQEHALPATRWMGVIADGQSASEPFEAHFDQIGRQP